MNRVVLTDEEIARKVQEGNADMFGVLIERYEDKLLRYARRFLFDRDEGKDLVQDAFIKAYVNIKSFLLMQRFSPWMYRIAHNEFINALRKKTRFPRFSLDADTIFPHPIAKETADGEMERKELAATLDRHLGELDIKYREPLVLYYFEEMDYATIADVLQIPVATVGVRLKRGRERVRAMLAKEHIRP